MYYWVRWMCALFLLLFIVGCVPLSPSDTPSSGTLSDLQITACNAADEAGTCDSRLPEVGIVLSEECCERLGKCCG